jgi:hypothetical protein
MDVKEAGSKGGQKAWGKLTAKERSKIMSDRLKLRWERYRENKGSQPIKPSPSPFDQED